MNKAETIVLAAGRGAYAAAGALHTAGGTIFSYGLPLAEVRDGEVVALPGLDEKHSVTTSRHQRQIAPFVGKHV